jgi:NADH-quinone oxidoreductase subunit N
MEFTLSLTAQDMALLLPEFFMTVLLTVVLFLDFIFPRMNKNILAYLSIAGMIGMIALLVGYFIDGTTGTLFKQMYVLDPLAIAFKIFILFATVLVFLASIQYLKKIPAFKGEYYFLILLSALGMMLMASANDLLSLFITVEFSTFNFYVLVAYHRDDLKSSEAGLKFFILGVFTAAILAFGISLVYGETGTLIFSEMVQKMPSVTPGLVIGFLLIIMALAFKIGAVPFHVWIPDIYEGAPTPITALLSIAPKGAAFAIILRVLFSTLGDFKVDWVWFIAVLSALSMTYGNIVAISQTNIKRLLAYSGIAQIGNLLIGVAAGTKMGGDSLLFYLLTYLFASVGAFTVVIIFSNLTDSDDIEDYNGLSRRSPFLAFAMLVFLLSLAGVPPLAGFIGKLYIFTAAMKEGLIALVAIGGVNIVISLYYYLVVVKKIYINPAKDASAIPVPFPLKAVVMITIAGVLILGIYPGPVMDWTATATELFSHLTGP